MGGCVPSSMFRLQRFDVSDLSPLFSQRCARFCTHQSFNPFVFRRFRTLCQKPPGVGYPLSFWNCQVVHAGQRTEQPRFSTSHSPSLHQPGRGLVFFQLSTVNLCVSAACRTLSARSTMSRLLPEEGISAMATAEQIV